jgi:hypothetical protein
MAPGHSQEANKKAFTSGEWLHYRLHYGFLNASYADFNLVDTSIDSLEVHHVIAKGKTTGIANWFFKVDDRYESYFTKEDHQPIKFIRKVNEGGYTMDMEVNFSPEEKKAELKDLKRNKNFKYEYTKSIQDLISGLYYLRNTPEISQMQKGSFFEMDMLYDDDGIFTFKLQYLGAETIKTAFGKVPCLKFRPYVQSGRVFKEQESITLWVSKDANKIPIRIQADILVGSIRADLDAYKGLKNPFVIQVN